MDLYDIPKGLRVGIYNRCSTDEEAQLNALSKQAEESRELAVSFDWIIVAQYIESESGTTSKKRTEYQKMLEDIESHLYDVIMIKSMDRLARNVLDTYYFLSRLQANNIRLYIYIDRKFYDPGDSLKTGIDALVAEQYSRDLSKKIKNAHRRRQLKKGGTNINSRVFGWDKLGKDQFIINEKEANFYRIAFDKAYNGKGYRTIANEMYALGARTTNGTRISDSHWKKLLTSPRAHGTVVLHTNEYNFETKKRVDLPPDQWIYMENALPPIVTKEYQDMVLDVIEKRSRAYRYDRDLSMIGHYILSGKLYCGECGAPYYRYMLTTHGEKVTHWRCSIASKLGKKDITPAGCDNIVVNEEVIFNTIQAACKEQFSIIFDIQQNIIDEALRNIKNVLSDKDYETEITRLEKEKSTHLRKKEVLFDKLMSEVISDEDFKKFNSEIENKIAGLEKKIEIIKNHSSDNESLEGRIDKIKEKLNNEAVNRAKVKEIIGRIDKIIVNHDSTLNIKFNKNKMISMLKIYGCELDNDDFTDDMFDLCVPYVHPTSMRAIEKEQNIQKIIKCIKDDPCIELANIPKRVGLGYTTVYKTLKHLREEGKLVRKFGESTKWEFIGENQTSGSGKINARKDKILEFVKKNPGISAKDIAEQLDIPKPTTSRYIGQLEAEGKVHADRSHKVMKVYTN